MYILYSKYDKKYFSKRVGIRNYWTVNKERAMKFEDLNAARLIAGQTLCEIQDISNLKYYNLNQNNSGGYCIRCKDSNDEVDAFISIQAPNVKIAKMIAERILEPYREYCPCCGERWSDEYLEEDDATDKPYVMSKPYDKQEDPFWCWNNKLVIYNYDGSKEIYDLNKNLKGDN